MSNRKVDNFIRDRKRPSAYLAPLGRGGASIAVCRQLKRDIVLSTGRGDTRITAQEAIELIRELEAAVRIHYSDTGAV